MSGALAGSNPTHSGRTLIAGSLILAFSMAASGATAQATELVRAPMRVAFTRSAFSNVNPADAEAAFKVFMEAVGQKRGYALDSSTKIYDSLQEIEADVRKGGVSILILNSMDYLDTDIDAEMDPAFVHSEQGEALEEILLLVRREDGFAAVTDLRGRNIAVLGEPNGRLVEAWLDWLLLKEDAGTPEAFFGRVEKVAKPSAAVLPVFFGKTDACIVDRLAFNTLVEMNPQLGRHLISLAVSEPFLSSITFVARSGFASERRRQDTYDSLAELHLEPAGRQILTLFRIDALVPFKGEYLDSIRRLRTDCDRLRQKRSS